MELEEFYAKLSAYNEASQYDDFETKVTNKLSLRADLHVMIMLDKLLPGETMDMVCSAEHDQIWLSVDPEKLAAVITDEQIRELAYCNVFEDMDSLSMFV